MGPFLAGFLVDGDVELSWEPSEDNEEDLGSYCIYRGASSGFPLDADHVIGETMDIGFIDLDPGPGSLFYRITARDVNGNEGEASNEVNVSISTSSQNSLPNLLRMSSYPNPFNPICTISFTLPTSDYVTLAVFTASGREVIRLIDNEPFGRGTHSVNWTGQSESKPTAPSGIYFVRITSKETTESVKVNLIK